MNTSVEGIIVNNCQYAPIYLIQDPGATQANTYVLAPSNGDQPKPVSNNLKTFYENSGNIENGLVNVNAAARPAVVKKKESVLIGNNLKLASFLFPKNEHVNKQYVVENIVMKPNTSTTTSTPMPVNTVPKIDIDRKIVKLKEVPIINRTRPEKVLKDPKNKPKDNAPSPNQSKHTSVQLIKLGETYHSLNHLSKEQVKMVNQALKMFKDPDKTAPEPTYDPVTNTRYIYKVVSPKDLTVVGKKNFIVKEKKLTKIPKKIVEEKLVKPLTAVKEEPPEPEPPAETKVTRSGRKVKLPRQILTEDSPHKYKKKSGTIISCFQCPAEFSSLYRLQKHYENHPTHIPSKIHSNLFHCLLAIIKSGSDNDKTNIFIQQLEQLIVKLKSLLPCLLKKVDGSEGQSCTINDDIGRLFGMNPGKYNIDVEALNCVKDKNGYCIHNPPKVNQYIKDPKSSTLLKHNEEMAEVENETENCARINSVAKWPTVSKRIWKLKQKTHELSAKKMRLKSEGDTLIDLGTEDLIFNIEENNTASTTALVDNTVSKLLESTQECNVNCPPVESQSNNITIAEPSKPKNNYVQFHSAHFDIRSSPIKPSSTVFRKFQINPSKMNNYQVQVIRSLEMVDKDHKHVMLTNTDNSLHSPMTSSNNNMHVCTTTDNGLHVSLPNADDLNVDMPNTDNSLHVTLPSSSNGLHVTLPNTNNGLHGTLPNSNNSLHVTLNNSNNNLHDTMPNSSSSLHESLPLHNGLHGTLPTSNNSLHVSLPSSNNNLHVTLPSSNNNLHVTLPSSNSNLHVTLPSASNGIHVSLPNSDNSLHVPLNSDNSLDISLPNTDNSLHDIFKDDVDLACKDDSNIDPELKDWIISTSEKSEDSFTKSSSLIEPTFLHVRDSVDKSMDKNLNHNDMPSLDGPDSRLLSNQGESVLNFLETLGNDLVYPETEIRNNGVDFQLDLFTFHNS